MHFFGYHVGRVGWKNRTFCLKNNVSFIVLSITIHYVNAQYDEGNIIFQAKCPIFPTDTPDMIAEKVHTLEYEHFPRVIRELWG